MAVNSILICEKIGEYRVKKLHAGCFDCRIRHVTIYNPLISTKSNTAYIVLDPKHFSKGGDADESAFMIVMGAVEPDVMEQSIHECVCVSAEYGLGKLYERVHDIIERYNRWEDTLSEILLEGRQFGRSVPRKRCAAGQSHDRSDGQF
ncbi:MAG: hypothetical protein QM689_08260 [Oscillospiraceae bacterium]